MVCFHCPIPIPRPTPMQIQKGYTGTDSDGDSYAKSQWKQECIPVGCVPPAHRLNPRPGGGGVAGLI